MDTDEFELVNPLSLSTSRNLTFSDLSDNILDINITLDREKYETVNFLYRFPKKIASIPKRTNNI